MKKIDSLRLILDDIQATKLSHKYEKFVKEYEKLMEEIPDSLFIAINEIDERLNKEAFKQRG